MAHPWPACTQTIEAIGTVEAKSASSHTIMADLPPSSRKTRLSVAAPFSMIRLPVAVDPVNEIRSTLGDSVSSSPTRWSDDVTTLTTPGGDVGLLGDEAPEAGGVPGRVGRGLQDHGVARGQDRAHLVERDLDRVVPRHDGADDAHRLLDDAAPAGHPHLLAVGEATAPTRTRRSSWPASPARRRAASRPGPRRSSCGACRPRR